MMMAKTATSLLAMQHGAAWRHDDKPYADVMHD
jgi:hypothetical protein